MLHHFPVTIFGYEFLVLTNTWMMILFAIGGSIAASLLFRRERLALRVLALSVLTAVVAFLGARIFHLLFERDHMSFTLEDLTHFDGMTFYGSLIAGVLFAYAFTALFMPRSTWPKILDVAALVSAFGYGFLRVGCFANGCCWGRLTSVPWAVVYGPGSEMPYIGLPVHPVQLYDAFVGFLIFGILIAVWRKGYRGLGLPLFLVLSSIGRFITEFYRGDSYRGTNVMLHLSTSQAIAIFLFLIGCVWIFVYFKSDSKNSAAHLEASV